MTPRTFRILLAVVVAAVFIVAAGPRAFAADDPAEIFATAREQFKEGQFEEALKGFEKVVALSGSPNAMFYAGKALRELGRLDAAYARFEMARTQAAHKADEEDRYAQTRASADEALRDLEPRISKLVITVPASITGAEVLVDGEPLASSSWGESLPMMPGQHTVVATAPSYERISTTVDLKAGKSKTIPLFASAVVKVEQPKPGPDPDTPQEDGTLLMAGIIVGGVGVVSLGVGAVFGGLSLGKKSEREDNCNGLACNPDGLAAAEDGTTFGNVSTATLVVGGVALAVGISLVILSLGAGDTDESAWHPTRPTTLRF